MRWNNRKLDVAELRIEPEDRLIVFSDGFHESGYVVPDDISGEMLSFRRSHSLAIKACRCRRF